MFFSAATYVTNKIFKDRTGSIAVLTANEAQGIFVTKFHIIYHQTVQEALWQWRILGHRVQEVQYGFGFFCPVRVKLLIYKQWKIKITSPNKLYIRQHCHILLQQKTFAYNS